ncbi:MAG TPA: NAD(P)(+) transhydrogenase (Re/Si-specific) subunit beta [Jiangellaceae bacterium]|nr:NAD(P)(+) transhydrogenase (Re/Si-specific) subunit beta [Jiangellaceae bacterium]
MIPVWAQLAYLVAAVCFVLALKGLSSPRSARNGNLVGVAGAVVAVVVTFLVEDVDNLFWIIGALAVGSVVGAVFARRVAMTAMPQLVALFNGVGGGAAALVALLELVDPLPRASLAAVAFTALIGAVSFSGSAVTFAKLQELMTGRAVTFPGGPYLSAGVLVVAIGLAVLVVTTGDATPAVLLAIAGLVFGVLLVLPVGGADVPIVISLLNAFTGLAVAAGGYVLDNTLLLVAGTLVGASGTILTRLMAQAMGRSVISILFGAFRSRSTAGTDGQGADRPVRSVGPEDVAILLGFARKVVVVPGYGLAVAQAQHTVHELVTLLEGRGVDVSYAIHPVAGRMPGHMNVLLAEANVPYEQLREMETANLELRTADVALVVGANDVVNPAARTSPSAPIYGMPILDVDQAQAVVFLKRSMRPGFAGIENELLYDPRTALLFGDAKDSLTKIVAAVKAV